MKQKVVILLALVLVLGLSPATGQADVAEPTTPDAINPAQAGGSEGVTVVSERMVADNYAARPTNRTDVFARSWNVRIGLPNKRPQRVMVGCATTTRSASSDWM